MLPQMRHQDGISKWRSVSFGGIVHTLGAGNGDIWDDRNIVSDDAPVLRTRRAEHNITSSFYGTQGCLQIGPGENDRIEVGQSKFRYKGVVPTSAFGGTGKLQSITPFNRFALMMPAKRWIRTDVIAIVPGHGDLPAGAHDGDVYCVDVESDPLHGNNVNCYAWSDTENAWVWIGKLYGTVEAYWHQSGSTHGGTIRITDGQYAGEPASANTVVAYSGDFRDYFNTGDGLTFSGGAFTTDRTLVVREVQQRKLIFDDHTFDGMTLNTDIPNVFIDRLMPDMDQICVNENRVWGYRGKNVYACKLGDFKNWNVFDGLADDSYASEVLGEGELTGCVAYKGYPMFFKPDAIYKVYGNRPSNFEITMSASTGTVNKRTLAIANETLFYLSKVGVMAYNGGVPQPVSDALGDLIGPWPDAQAFSDRWRYVLWHGATSEFFEYDPRRGVWHRQEVEGWNGTISYAFRLNDMAAFVSTAADLWAVQAPGTPETITYEVEFADFTEDSADSPAYGANAKGTGKLQLRLALGANSTAEVSMRFDSRGDWLPVKTLETAVKRSFYLPIIPRRSDHFRIKIEGTGYMELYSLSRESYKGSALRTI